MEREGKNYMNREKESKRERERERVCGKDCDVQRQFFMKAKSSKRERGVCACV